jgi:hypothetical protein
VAASIKGKRFVQSALKFVLAGIALVIVVGLGAIFYSLYESGQETKEPAVVQPQAGQQQANAQEKPPADPASAQCRVSDPGNGYVSGKYIYRLSNQVFPPSHSLEKEIHDRYGNNAELADWADLKAMLVNEDDIHKFIQDTDPASKHELQLRQHSGQPVRQRNSARIALPLGPARRQSASGLVRSRQRRLQRYQSWEVEPFRTSFTENATGAMNLHP